MASAGLLQHIPRSFTPPRIYSPTRIYLTWSGETLVHDWRGAARAGTRASLTGRRGCQLFFLTSATVKRLRCEVLYFVYVFQNATFLFYFKKSQRRKVYRVFVGKLRRLFPYCFNYRLHALVYATGRECTSLSVQS